MKLSYPSASKSAGIGSPYPSASKSAGIGHSPFPYGLILSQRFLKRWDWVTLFQRFKKRWYRSQKTLNRVTLNFTNFSVPTFLSLLFPHSFFHSFVSYHSFLNSDIQLAFPTSIFSPSPYHFYKLHCHCHTFSPLFWCSSFFKV